MWWLRPRASEPSCTCRGGRVLFFFSSRRRHTRWTGDWSSDVCSSDLAARAAGHASGTQRVRNGPEVLVLRGRPVSELVQVRLADVDPARGLSELHRRGALESEERRVGKECRSRGSRVHEEEKTIEDND